MPGEPQAAVHGKPDKGGRDIAQERPALESSRLESGGVSDANRNEGCIRVDVAGSHAGGRFRGDRRLPSSTLSARGARRDPHDFARRRDVDGDGATKHRNAVERLRERDMTHTRGSTHVVAHDGQRVQVFVLESEAIDVPHELVPQGDGESRPGSRPAGSIQDAKRTRIRVQTRTATARERRAPELGPRARRPLRRRPPLADVEVRAERARPDRRLLTGGQRPRQTDDGTGGEDEGKTGPQHHDALLVSCSETPDGPERKRRRSAKVAPVVRRRSVNELRRSYKTVLTQSSRGLQDGNPPDADRGFAGLRKSRICGRGSRVDGTRITRILQDGVTKVPLHRRPRPSPHSSRPLPHPVNPRDPRSVTPVIRVIRVPSSCDPRPV